MSFLKAAGAIANPFVAAQAALGSGVAKSFGGENAKEITHKQADLDPQSQALIDRQREGASKSDSQVANELTDMTGAHGDIINQPMNQNQGLVSGPNDLDQALQSRARAKFETANRDVKHESQGLARKLQAQRLNTVAGQVAQRDAIKQSAYNNSINQKLQKEQQRLGFIESIAGTAFSGAKMAIGGMPSGAIHTQQPDGSQVAGQTLGEGTSMTGGPSRSLGGAFNA